MVNLNQSLIKLFNMEEEKYIPIEKIVVKDQAWYIVTCETCSHASRLFTFNFGPTVVKHCAGCKRTNKKHSVKKDKNQKSPR